MDIIERKSVKVPNAVIISEVTGDEQIEEVTEFLKRFGSISRVIKVDDMESEFFQSIIFEYNTGVAVNALEPLPCNHVSDSGVSYRIQSLASVYTQCVGNDTTKSYLTDIKYLAKMSGRDFADVLKDMMSQIAESIKETEHDQTEQVNLPENLPTSPRVESQPSAIDPNIQGAQRSSQSNHTASSPAHSLTTMSAHDLNPPEVQRVVVEHIVKREDFSGQQFSQKLRVFSGKDPRPTYEPDYDAWRSSVELLMSDPSISKVQQSRKILESILPPAADVVKHLNPNSSPTEYLKLLDSAYGTVQDGGELYAKFLDTFQNTGEKPSSYLQRLQVALTCTVKRGGASSNDFDRLLITQFCRGCWDDPLLTALQLKQKRENPPTFPDLLLLLRTEEDQNATKNMRMRQHLSSTKQKVTSHLQTVEGFSNGNDSALTLNSIQELSKQVAEIQSQLVKMTTKSKTQNKISPFNTKPKEKRKLEKVIIEPTKLTVKTQNTPPKPWYCFRCGEDGHIKPNCENEPDPVLVTEKRKLFKEKQRKWEAENPSAVKEHLN
uniref:CCHC-type domain-containing protein n=1 Tax=Kryptolebias marmoratus TaxID=37003 RepID=A0A3Q3AL30_KRYMA